MDDRKNVFTWLNTEEDGIVPEDVRDGLCTFFISDQPQFIRQRRRRFESTEMMLKQRMDCDKNKKLLKIVKS